MEHYLGLQYLKHLFYNLATHQPDRNFIAWKQIEVDVSEFNGRSVLQLKVCPAMNKVYKSADGVERQLIISIVCHVGHHNENLLRKT